MSDPRQNLNQDCEQAIMLQSRMLLGEMLDSREHAELKAHLSNCIACRSESAEIEKMHNLIASAMSATKLSQNFAAKTMAALPLQPVETAEAPALRVFAPPSSRRWPWAISGLAAAVVVSVLVAWLAFTWQTHLPTNVSELLTAKRATLIDSDGRAVRNVKPGLVYKVKEDTVLPLQGNGLVKLQQGAEFSVSADPASAAPALMLQTGDLYAHGGNGEKPIHVNCNTFETLLHAGDFFVSDQAGENTSGGVVIVFNGHAQIKRENEAMPLRSGQIFLSVGNRDTQLVQILEMTEAMTRIAEAPQIGDLPDAATLRKEYENRVRGYHRELETLKTLAQRENDEHQQAELKERYQRMSAYYEAHRRKLETLNHEMPLDIIKRGLNGRTDSSSWM
jgi:anti-sigma factor RsiW